MNYSLPSRYCELIHAYMSDPWAMPRFPKEILYYIMNSSPSWKQQHIRELHPLYIDILIDDTELEVYDLFKDSTMSLVNGVIFEENYGSFTLRRLAQSPYLYNVTDLGFRSCTALDLSVLVEYPYRFRNLVRLNFQNCEFLKTSLPEFLAFAANHNLKGLSLTNLPNHFRSHLLKSKLITSLDEVKLYSSDFTYWTKLLLRWKFEGFFRKKGVKVWV